MIYPHIRVEASYANREKWHCHIFNGPQTLGHWLQKDGKFFPDVVQYYKSKREIIGILKRHYQISRIIDLPPGWAYEDTIYYKLT
jgi:hypothetical protein